MSLKIYVLTVKSPIDVRFIELMPLGELIEFIKKGYFNVKEMIEKYTTLYIMSKFLWWKVLIAEYY